MSRNPPPAHEEFNPVLSGADYPKELIDGLVSVIGPSFFATVDLPEFVRYCSSSFSLCLVEKERVFQAFTTLSQFQCNELNEVWVDEIVEFRRLVPKEWAQVSQLSAKAWLEANMLANLHGVGYLDPAEERAALEKMLAKKYDTPKRRMWVASAFINHESVWVRHVFGAMPGIKTSNCHLTTSTRPLTEIPDVF